ncbi:MAG: ferritin family protein [Desulfotomaculaceae bacterium]|nr:ferritin family protein [Desulfotomaculaceae bacterium]
MGPSRISEIVRVAMRIEEKGARFYSAMSGRTEDERARQIFLKLADEEKEHVKVFQKLLGSYADDEFLEPEVSDYLNAVLQENIFPVDGEPGQADRKVGNMKDALAIGVQAEKDAILAYHELLSRIRSESGRKLLYGLIEEEKMHLIELRSYYEEI